MIKNKILFVIPRFNIGGTLTSLVNLMTNISDEFTIDVFVMSDCGPCKNLLKNARILKPSLLLSILLLQIKLEKSLIIRFLACLFKILAKCLKLLNIDMLNIAMKRAAKSINVSNYDTVVAFEEGVTTRFVSYMEIPHKIAWVHCDYSMYINPMRSLIKEEFKVYENFRRIICVSEYTKQRFLDFYPTFQNRTECIYNIIDLNRIHSLSLDILDEVNFYSESMYNILSVGRFASVKRFDYIPALVSSLLKQGLGTSFMWYLIVSGTKEDFSAFDKKVKLYGVTNHIKVIGEKQNPYPYFLKSNALAILSESEACPYVLLEAKSLGLYVISTDFGSSHEFLSKSTDGIITSIDQYAEILGETIKNRCRVTDKSYGSVDMLLMNRNAIRKIKQVLCEK